MNPTVRVPLFAFHRLSFASKFLEMIAFLIDFVAGARDRNRNSDSISNLDFLLRTRRIVVENNPRMCSELNGSSAVFNYSLWNGSEASTGNQKLFFFRFAHSLVLFYCKRGEWRASEQRIG